MAVAATPAAVASTVTSDFLGVAGAAPCNGLTGGGGQTTWVSL